MPALMPPANSTTAKLAQTLDEALALLQDLPAPAGQPASALQQQAPSSLLQECMALCAQREAAAIEPIRSIHHFACTGGTLISKCLAAMPNTQLLSEVDPLSTLLGKQGTAQFAPTDIIQQMRQSTRGTNNQLLIDLFLNNMAQIHTDASNKGLRVIIRDHAHSHFCTGSEIPQRPTLHSMLAGSFPLRSVVTVRHPLDSYLSLCENKWQHFSPFTLDEYCKRYLAFLDAYADVPVIKYEDFVQNPKATVEQICDNLQLPYVNSFEALGSVFSIETHSKRAAVENAAAMSTALFAKLADERQSSMNYNKLLKSTAYRDEDCQAWHTSFSSQAQATTAQADKCDLHELVMGCINSQDMHATVDALIDSGKLDKSSYFDFYYLLANQFIEHNDNMTALNFLIKARDFAHEDADKGLLLFRVLNRLGRQAEAVDLFVMHPSFVQHLNPAERKLVQSTYNNARQIQQSRHEHGHELLLAHLQANWENMRSLFSGRKPAVIEIGTTRENVPGQGSTRKIAEYCKQAGLHFVTVDMDPHNTHEAASLFKQLNVDFEAITDKGEDFLRAWPGPLDFVFLDAYDFDHGNHSQLRQSRYIKYLGSKIDELACHRMHLDCAQSVVQKLSPVGVLCLDDTWLVDGLWQGKGTTAMPYLLSQDLELVDVRNRAALLRRKQGRL